jgi:hypothetical protein
MSFLPIYNTSRTESQKDGYKNEWAFSVIKMDGNYIPSWYLVESNLSTTIYLQELAELALSNGDIDIVTTTDITTSGYTTGYGNNRVYADKQAQTLTGIHRLKIDVGGTIYYSGIFYNIDNKIPLYIRTSNVVYVRVYKYS